MFRGGITMKFMRTTGFLLALFGAVGFATSAQAAREADPNAKDLVLKGDAKCTGCHDEADEPVPSMLDLKPGVLRIGKTKHGTKADSRTPSCTNCHGESLDHNNYKGKDKPPKPDRVFTKHGLSSAEVRNDACISCHQKDAKRSHWEGSTHQLRDVACNDCHQVHTNKDKVRNKRTQSEVCFTCHKEQRAQINRPSHHPIPEGKMTCSDCHNAHGSAGPKLMVRDSVNSTCYTCHMEKRGPFVHNHEPVSEDCGNCHNPHGTTAENMLKVRAPFLCHQCHTPHGGFIPQLIGAQVTAPTAAALGKGTTNVTQGRACLNCHTQVHGSNNPAATNPTPQFNLR
jgi:DmsE family decaheme c-type cytochrome